MGGAFSFMYIIEIHFYLRWNYQIVPSDLTFTQPVAPESIQKVTMSEEEEMVPVTASSVVSSSNQSVPAATCVPG